MVGKIEGWIHQQQFLALLPERFLWIETFAAWSIAILVLLFPAYLIITHKEKSISYFQFYMGLLGWVFVVTLFTILAIENFEWFDWQGSMWITLAIVNPGLAYLATGRLIDEGRNRQGAWILLIPVFGIIMFPLSMYFASMSHLRQ